MKVKGQDQLLLGHSRDVKGQPDEKTGPLKGFDPKTGKELWKSQGLNSYVYSSPLYAGGVAVNTSGYGGSALAVKLGGEGDITRTALIHPGSQPSESAPESSLANTFTWPTKTVPHCYELKSRNDLWKDEPRLKGQTWGSLVHADGRLYLLMKNGDTLVMAANPKFELLATNSLGAGEGSNSSIVISNGQIFIRTFKNLWCRSKEVT